MTIYVGAVLGGPDTRESRAVLAIQGISRIGARRRKLTPLEGGSIDLVFHVPGSLIRPDYEGLRTGKFSRKQQMLMIQVAVPEVELEAEDPERFIFWAMREAVAMTAPAFKKAKIPFSADDHLALVDAVEAEYTALKADEPA